MGGRIESVGVAIFNPAFVLPWWAYKSRRSWSPYNLINEPNDKAKQ